MRGISALLLATSMLGFGGAGHALTVDEAKKVAMDAYVYGYSLITTEVTRV